MVLQRELSVALCPIKCTVILFKVDHKHEEWFPAPGSAVVFRGGGFGGVDAGALKERVNEQRRRVNGTQQAGKPIWTGSPLTSRLHGSCRTGAASWQRTPTRHRVEPIQPCFLPSRCERFTSGRSCSSTRVVFLFPYEPRHFCAPQSRRFPPVPKTHSGRKEPSQDSENTRSNKEQFLQFFATHTFSADLNLLYLHADVPVWGTKEMFRDKQSCLSLSQACFYF